MAKSVTHVSGTFCHPCPRPLIRAARYAGSTLTEAKVLLLNEMVRQRVRPADLARRLHTTPQEITRLTDVRHRTRIDSIEAAVQALGKQLELRVT
jgi:antitoxin HicB